MMRCEGGDIHDAEDAIQGSETIFDIGETPTAHRFYKAIHRQAFAST
jgi:hypothetical protein